MTHVPTDPATVPWPLPAHVTPRLRNDTVPPDFKSSLHGHSLTVSCERFISHLRRPTKRSKSPFPHLAVYSCTYPRSCPPLPRQIKSVTHSFIPTTYYTQAYLLLTILKRIYYLLHSSVPTTYYTQAYLLLTGLKRTYYLLHSSVPTTYWTQAYLLLTGLNRTYYSLHSSVPTTYYTQAYLLLTTLKRTYYLLHSSVPTTYWTQAYLLLTTLKRTYYLLHSCSPALHHPLLCAKRERIDPDKSTLGTSQASSTATTTGLPTCHARPIRPTDSPMRPTTQAVANLPHTYCMLTCSPPPLLREAGAD